VASTRPEERQGVPGKSWVFSSADGKTRYRLLLLAQGGRVLGLYAQGEAAAVEKQAAVLDEDVVEPHRRAARPLPGDVVEGHNASLAFPRLARDPALLRRGDARDELREPAPGRGEGGPRGHASLSVTFEAVPEGGGLAEYYEATRRRLGDNFQVTSHAAFRGGFVDVMRTETPVTVTYVKRFYFARDGRGCSLSFEAREDVFPRASRWADFIASTLAFAGAGDAAR